jgi:hypothetical protein
MDKNLFPNFGLSKRNIPSMVYQFLCHRLEQNDVIGIVNGERRTIVLQMKSTP